MAPSEMAGTSEMAEVPVARQRIRRRLLMVVRLQGLQLQGAARVLVNFLAAREANVAVQQLLATSSGLIAARSRRLARLRRLGLRLGRCR